MSDKGDRGVVENHGDVEGMRCSLGESETRGGESTSMGKKVRASLSALYSSCGHSFSFRDQCMRQGVRKAELGETLDIEERMEDQPIPQDLPHVLVMQQCSIGDYC